MSGNSGGQRLRPRARLPISLLPRPSIAKKAVSSAIPESRGGANVVVIGYDVAGCPVSIGKPDRQIGSD